MKLRMFNWKKCFNPPRYPLQKERTNPFKRIDRHALSEIVKSCDESQRAKGFEMHFNTANVHTKCGEWHRKVETIYRIGWERTPRTVTTSAHCGTAVSAAEERLPTRWSSSPNGIEHWYPSRTTRESVYFVYWGGLSNRHIGSWTISWIDFISLRRGEKTTGKSGFTDVSSSRRTAEYTRGSSDTH
jgi:hypothetical protein